MSRKKLLTLTQTLSGFSGQGIAMRVCNILETRAAEHAITQVCASLDRPTHPEILPDYWKALCAQAICFNVAEPIRVEQRPLVRIMSPKPELLAAWPTAAVRERHAQLRDMQFDQVLVSRMRLMPVWGAMEQGLGVRAA